MPQISIELALIAGRAVFLVFCFIIAAVAFIRWRRAADRSVIQFAEQTTAVMVRLGELEARLEAIQFTQTDLSERISSTMHAPHGNAAPSYQVAIRMARGGATRDELISSCGITRQEADLVQRLHAPVRARIAAVS